MSGLPIDRSQRNPPDPIPGPRHLRSGLLPA